MAQPVHEGVRLDGLRGDCQLSGEWTDADNDRGGRGGPGRGGRQRNRQQRRVQEVHDFKRGSEGYGDYGDGGHVEECEQHGDKLGEIEERQEMTRQIMTIGFKDTETSILAEHDYIKDRFQLL
eukprot:4281789-Heterocapsa_arctica.AAC.1